ncbi:MAG: hypothetical protein AAB904_02020 [Patescibacteria group bacterium]
MRLSHSLDGVIKFIIGWVVVFLIRLIPFRPPNVEPVLTTMMPFSKRYGIIGSFLFGFLSIAIFDLAVSKVGQWTLITGLAYGLVGIGSWAFFRNRESTRWNYLIYAVIGTLAYDALTGLTIGPLFFGQSLAEAFFGQIPFTAMHLAGNIAFSLTISPAIYRWVISNPRLEVRSLIRAAGPVRP